MKQNLLINNKVFLLLWCLGLPFFAKAQDPYITSSPVESATYGESYLYEITTGGNDFLGISIVLESGELPQGIVLTDFENGTGELSGIPEETGEFEIVLRAEDFFGRGTNQSFTLTVSKAEANIELSGLNATYDGNPKSASYTTVPAGLNVNLTYNGSTTEPVNVGQYAVEATIDEPNYSGSASGTLTIVRGEATIQLSDLEQVYDGSPKPVSYTTVPEGLPVDITYDGLSTVPVNAGTYAVEVRVTHGNYQGSASANLVVSKANATVNVTQLNQVYNGQPRQVSVSTVPAGLSYETTYDGSTTAPTNAGTYDVVVNIDNINYQGSFTDQLQVQKATGIVTLSAFTTTYNGTAQQVGVSTSPAGLPYEVTYNGSTTAPTNAGTYNVEATITSNNYAGEATGVFTINIANASVVISDLSVTYDGTEKPVTVTTDPEGINVAVTYDGETQAPIEAGTYQVEAVIDDSNYSGSATGSLVIDKATAEITFSRLTVTYNGEPQGANVTTSPEDLNLTVTYDGVENEPREIGTYSLEAEIVEDNYEGTASATFTIREPEGSNSRPVLTNLEQQPIVYQQGDGAVRITDSLIVNDFDNAYLVSAQVSITSGFEPLYDELSYDIDNENLEVNFDQSSGVLTITGEETRSNYEVLLRNVRYSNSFFGESTITEKTLSITVNDGFNDSNEASRQVNITVLRDLGIVNAFTPGNGDNVNDTWYLENLDQYTSVQIKIFERNGREVYNCQGSNCAWDGTYEGKELPSGMYFYTIDLNEGRRKFQGTVTILR
ncbi:MBG domain-containing protein [Fulvivirga maritima]|uniref:MBG domain-containing protein n=1 Tax=Fulvivirga maritima TaxID=2904247 RepID=UPI001F42EF51|nr:MBG domain-containing protein [Fulvivirga maritima]UII25496.1 MBG domain-containing protein [Fulvivirga maritima]